MENSKYEEDVILILELLKKASNLDKDAFNSLILKNDHIFWLTPCIKKDYPEVGVVIRDLYFLLKDIMEKMSKKESIFNLFLEFCINHAEVIAKRLEKSLDL